MNKNTGRATKGSRYCLQNYIIKDSGTLGNLIFASSPSLLSFTNGQIQWVSPNTKNDFYEYRDDFLAGLCLESIDLTDAETKLRKFWPKNGPQWDGLAIVKSSEGKKGVLLIEAKAHPEETKSDLKATNQGSIDMIENSLKYVQGYMSVAPCDWTRNYYQLANRIAFLFFMNKTLKIPTWLVLANFVNDKSYKETSLNEWLNYYNETFMNMGIHQNCKLLDRIIQIFPESLI